MDVTSYVDHEKRVAWFSISMRACGSVLIVMVFRLLAYQVGGALLKINEIRISYAKSNI